MTAPCEAFTAEHPVLATAPTAAMRDHVIDCDDRACRDAVAWNLWLVGDNAGRQVEQMRAAREREARQRGQLFADVERLLGETRGRKTLRRSDLDGAYRRALGLVVLP